MTSVTDLANDALAKLDTIIGNTNNTVHRLDTTNSEINTLIANVQALNATNAAGFSNLSNGLAIMIERQTETNYWLDINDKQNQTIICWLTAMADVMCRQLHRLNDQVALQTQMAATLDQMRDTFELVYGEQTVEVLRRNELERKIAVCCPPPKPVPSPVTSRARARASSHIRTSRRIGHRSSRRQPRSSDRAQPAGDVARRGSLTKKHAGVRPDRRSFIDGALSRARRRNR